MMRPVWIVLASVAGTGAVVAGSFATVYYLQTTAPQAETVRDTMNSTESAGTNNQSTAATAGSQKTSPNMTASQATDQVAGEYWCRSYNVNGAGGTCSLQRRLYLYSDGTYDFGTKSTYRVSGNQVIFDGDLASRGPATLTADRELRWEFTRDDKPYTITYYWRQTIASASPTATKTPQSEVTTIEPSPTASATTSALVSPSSTTTTTPNIAGSYACVSSGSGPCDTSQRIEVFSNNSWYFGSNVGTYQVSGSTVIFSSPYAGGSSWASAGPADWGPATLSGNSLTFSSGGVPVRWER